MKAKTKQQNHNLELITTEQFYNSDANFYRDVNTDEIYMTIEQLANCLGYNSKKGIEMILARNDYLRDTEFSVTHTLKGRDNKTYQTITFTEDGIYEVTSFSTKTRAKEFRLWVKKHLSQFKAKSELKIITSGFFNGSEANFYCDESCAEIYMTMAQLANCLGYKTKHPLENMISRHPKLKDRKFSTTPVLGVLEGNHYAQREVRLFNERGIYEVTFLSTTKRAEKFRDWVSDLLHKLRTKELQVVNTPTAIDLAHTNSLLNQLLVQSNRHTDQIKELREDFYWLKRNIGIETNTNYKSTEWKSDISGKINHLSKLTDICPKSKIYSQIYSSMKYGYHINLKSYISQYKAEFGDNTGSVATIDVVEHNLELKNIFSEILNEWISQCTELSEQC